MSGAPAGARLDPQFTRPPEPPERGADAWLFADGRIHLVRVVGRVVARTDAGELPLTSYVLGGRVTFAPTDRFVAIPEPDPYAMPTEILP